MFADNISTAKAARPMAGPWGPRAENLREMARKHQVCYEVWPEWSMAGERKIQIGFELQLCGTNAHTSLDVRDDPVPGCAQCVSTYGELRQIAEWSLPHEERASRYEIGAFDHALHIAPGRRKSRSEVVLSIHIMHRHDFNRAVDECEDRCLKETRQRLQELEIVEGVWHEPAGEQIEEGRKETR